jgi:hypothetical protein
MKSLAQSLLFIFCVSYCVLGQSGPEQVAAGTKESTVDSIANGQQSPVTIVLKSGVQLVVDEISEDSGGYWYRLGNVSTFLDRTKVQGIRRLSDEVAGNSKSSVQTNIKWRLTDAAKVKDFFQYTFNRPLPLSSFGQSEIHNRWGLDHRNGMDINLHPDSPEGRALIVFLRTESIPFLTFRTAIPSVATGPHIHVGNPSPRVSIH